MTKEMGPFVTAKDCKIKREKEDSRNLLKVLSKSREIHEDLLRRDKGRALTVKRK